MVDVALRRSRPAARNDMSSARSSILPAALLLPRRRSSRFELEVGCDDCGRLEVQRLVDVGLHGPRSRSFLMTSPAFHAHLLGKVRDRDCHHRDLMRFFADLRQHGLGLGASLRNPLPAPFRGPVPPAPRALFSSRGLLSGRLPCGAGPWRPFPFDLLGLRRLVLRTTPRPSFLRTARQRRSGPAPPRPSSASISEG